MNEHQLSKRLSEVAALVPSGSRLADIGTDHAYLPVHLLIQGKICMAIASDINEGPYLSARKQVEKLGLDGVVEVRRGDGLETIQVGEVDVTSIAGMGGALICNILNEGIEKLENVKRLIIQPNVAAYLIRQWFLDHGWELKKELMVEEDGKFYEILLAEPGEATLPYQGLDEHEWKKAVFMGPFLLKEKPDAFIEKWKSELDKRKKIIQSLQLAEGGEREEKLKKVTDEILLIEEGIRG